MTMAARATATAFLRELKALRDPREVEGIARFFRADPNGSSDDNVVLGVRHGEVFELAKQYTDMPLGEIERLLESAYYEARLGAVSVMDFQVRAKKTSDGAREALYDLYLRRHDRINNWDLVDRAAPWVVGGFLRNRERDVLRRLARSANPWERRTAIVSTAFFLRSSDVTDTFEIAELLVYDAHELVQKAVGSWVREAGKKDRARLLRFLDEYAADMPRAALRYAVEKLEAPLKARYMEAGAPPKRENGDVKARARRR